MRHIVRIDNMMMGMMMRMGTMGMMMRAQKTDSPSFKSIWFSLREN